VTVFVDYDIAWNPLYSSLKIKNKDKEITLDEMQKEILSHKIFIWKSEEEGTFRVDPKNPFNHRKEKGNKSLHKEKILQHVQSLRAIGYSVINIIQLSNAKMLYEILKNMYPNLLPNLRDDVLKCIFFNTDKHEFKDDRIK